MANESIAKAWFDIGYWSVARDDDPPLLHNHERLLMGCGLYNKLSDEQIKFLEQMHPMYIAGRYPQYKKQVASTLNEQASQYFIEQTKKFQQWILQRYLEKTKPLNL